MNELNSVILEGTVKAVKTDGIKTVITLATHRLAKDDDGNKAIEESVFDVVAYGSFGEAAQKHAKVGRGIRVVGRLRSVDYKDGDLVSKVFVVAEHIEYKPFAKESVA